MAQISVIVPVYKVEPYIHRCVDSILGQSFSDFELILVDDGSPDNCGVICDAYAQKDSRVHVIHQENGGLSLARNAGIDWMLVNSEAQWLTFVDSDDCIHPEMLERLLRAARQQKTLISVCAYTETSGGELPEADGRQEFWQAADFFVEHYVSAVIACGKLYHRSCFSQIRYPAGKLHEDEFVTYRLLFAAERIAFLPSPLYAYFVNPKGITKRTWSPKRLDAWEAYDAQIAFFEDRGDSELVKLCLKKYLWNAKGQLNQAKQSRSRSYYSLIQRKIRSLLRKIWRSGYRDLVAEYLKMEFDNLLAAPFIWKDNLKKKLGK